MAQCILHVQFCLFGRHRRAVHVSLTHTHNVLHISNIISLFSCSSFLYFVVKRKTEHDVRLKQEQEMENAAAAAAADTHM